MAGLGRAGYGINRQGLLAEDLLDQVLHFAQGAFFSKKLLFGFDYADISYRFRLNGYIHLIVNLCLAVIAPESAVRHCGQIYGSHG